MSNEQYFKNLGKQRFFMMQPSDNTVGFIRNKVAKYLLN